MRFNLKKIALFGILGCLIGIVIHFAKTKTESNDIAILEVNPPGWHWERVLPGETKTLSIGSSKADNSMIGGNLLTCNY